MGTEWFYYLLHHLLLKKHSEWQRPLDWKLYCTYWPQSPEQIERIHRTLLVSFTRLTMETAGDWVALLPFILHRVRSMPYALELTSPLR